MAVVPKNVLAMFVETACKYPNQVAIEMDEQIWTYGELLTNVHHIAQNVAIDRGQIVYQYMDRSLEMVCGILGIMCAGGVYCPLNTGDPPMRIRSLLDEVQGHIALVHRSTRDNFLSISNGEIKIIDIEKLLSMDFTANSFTEKGNLTFIHELIFFDFALFTEIFIDDESSSYIIGTSGTTGRPKIILHTHKSLQATMQAMINWDARCSNKVLQVAACSWIIHLFEILLPLIVDKPGTLILLRPGDNLNMSRFCMNIKNKEITFIFVAPSMIKAMIDYLELNNHEHYGTLETLRIILSGGEASKPKHLAKLKSFAAQAKLFMIYGLTEINTAIGCYLDYDIDELANLNILPIGRPLFGYRCLLVDEIDGHIISSSNLNEIGQIHLAGNILIV